MRPIAIFYHCLFVLGDPPKVLPNAANIVREQMQIAKESGLLDAAAEIHFGINGGTESLPFVIALLPQHTSGSMHGIQTRNECRTIFQLENWLKDHEDWNVLYFHSKGATHPAGHDVSTLWRGCMMRHLVKDWHKCVSDLESGFDAVGVHWMTGDQTPPGQSIFAGNFWWAQSSFLRTLPSICERERIKTSGIDALESRYESEVWIGNGPRLPVIKDYHPDWNPSKIATCA